MARRNQAQEGTTMEPTENTAVAAESRTATVTMAGKPFTVSMPYAEGHVCNAAEASVLNQTRAENISNNLREQLKAILAGEGDNAALDDDERLAKAQELVTHRDGNYEFGVRAIGERAPRITDPIEREAMSIAREQVRALLSKNGIKLKDAPKDKLEAKIAEVSKMPAVRAEAEKRVAARSTVSLDDLDFGFDAPAEAQTTDGADGETVSVSEPA